MTSTVEQLIQAKSEQEAFRVIAMALDTIIERLEGRDYESGWDQPWGPPSDPYTIDTSGFDKAVDKHGAEIIKVIEEKLAVEVDPDERLALEAQLRLLKDTGQYVFPDKDKVHSVSSTDEDGNIVVDLPPVDDAKKELRREFARHIALDTEFGEEFVEAYAKGGPLLLYLSNRDYVMGLSETARLAMVEDVHEQSIHEAQSMGRDILKDTSLEGVDSVAERGGLEKHW